VDPIILFFVAGVIAGVFHLDLRLPSSIVNFITVFLLLAIGIKGGHELRSGDLLTIAPQAIVVILMGVFLPIIAYPILRKMGKLSTDDAASIAAHYGSVSVGTFAVAIGYLHEIGVDFEPYMPIFVALLEFPAIIVGLLLAKGLSAKNSFNVDFFKEIFFGRSILFIGLGVSIGLFGKLAPTLELISFFKSSFKGALAFFLLEMGGVAAVEIRSLLKKGVFFLSFGILMPLFSGALGCLIGHKLGLSLGGTTVFAVLMASSSYIAVPAAMRTSLPNANPTLSLGASLGVTFPFNILVGIPLFYQLSTLLKS